MPPVTAVLVRASLVYLVAGAAVGTLLMAAKAGYQLPAVVARAWPLHAEMLLFGWMVQLALGVAYWILPKHAAAPVRGPGVAGGAGRRYSSTSAWQVPHWAR